MKLRKHPTLFSHQLQNRLKQIHTQAALMAAGLFWAVISDAASTTDRFEFTRMVAHWAGYADAGYLPFIEDAKPEVAQVGFYGADFWTGLRYRRHARVLGMSEQSKLAAGAQCVGPLWHQSGGGWIDR